MMNKMFKKDIEKISEIRALLGNDYHLSVKYSIFESKIQEWKLYRNYNDTKVYFSPDNKLIMSNETNTIDDLYNFAKKHHKIDEHLYMSKFNIIIAFICMGLVILNIVFFNNDVLRGFIFGIDFMIIISSLLSHNIWNKNLKVNMLELQENFEKSCKEYKNEVTRRN